MRCCFVLEAQEAKSESAIAVPPIRLMIEHLDSDLYLANFEVLSKRSMLVQDFDSRD